MNRPWHVWLSFAICLAAVLVAMAWLTGRALKLDRAEAQAREELQQEIDIKLAVLRMDAALTPLLTQEANREFTTFGAPDTLQSADMQQRGGPTNALPPHVLLHFRGVGDQWSSPQVADAVTQSSDGQALEQREPRKQLNEIRHSIEAAQLFDALPPVRGAASDQLAMQSDYRLDQIPQTASNSMYGGNRLSTLSRQEVISNEPPTQKSKGDLNLNQRQLAKVTAKGQQELDTRNQALQSYQASQQMPRLPTGEVLTGDSRALWLASRLLYVRRIAVDGVEGLSGSLLNWPEIKTLLLEQISNLVPNSDLVPVDEHTPSMSFAPGRTLAALPVQLVAPKPQVDLLWTPIRVSLVAVWVCLALAAAAIAGLLLGILRLSERRAAFVAAVTHELRTPLTTFKMYSDMLAGGMVEDPQQKKIYLETLTTEADRLIHLVENVLSYARLERGRQIAKKSTTTAGAVLDRCVSRLAARADAAGMRLDVIADEPGQQTELSTDSAAVEQILFNLVDNACKYGQNGTTNHIELSLEVSEGSVTFGVQDDGPGFSANARKELFQPFSKSVEDAAQTAPGVGLGLALCHRLAVDLGGSLRLVESPQGARFALELPR